MAKSKKQKELEGTHRADRDKKSLPIKSVNEVSLPSGLYNKYAIQEWELQSKILIGKNMFDPSFTTMLLMFCNEAGIYYESIDNLKANGGMTITYPTGHVQVHPDYTVKTKAFDACKNMAKEFGFTPLALSKMEYENKPTEDNGLDKF